MSERFVEDQLIKYRKFQSQQKELNVPEKLPIANSTTLPVVNNITNTNKGLELTIPRRLPKKKPEPNNEKNIITEIEPQNVPSQDDIEFDRLMATKSKMNINPNRYQMPIVSKPTTTIVVVAKPSMFRK